MQSGPKLLVIDIKEGLGMCAEYPLETEAVLMVSLTTVLCGTLFAGIPLLLTAVSACKRVARKTGVEQPWTEQRKTCMYIKANLDLSKNTYSIFVMLLTLFLRA